MAQRRFRAHNGGVSNDDCTPARSIEDLRAAAIGAGTDPAGIPWAELAPDRLRGERTSLKWTRFDPDVLPMFVAEMDFAVAPEIRRTIVARVEASDTGYLDSPGPLAPVFADFARDRWGWEVDPRSVQLAADVSCGVVEPLRLVVPPTGGRVAVTTPVYPGFFEMLSELPVEVVQIPLAVSPDEREGGAYAAGSQPGAASPIHARLDLDALEREFAAGLDALVLSNPHNPHGLLHTAEELRALARLAAEHGVFVLSDEVHAPLTHRGRAFVPFAPIAAEAGALSVTATSASKGWNLAGVKCSVIVAADERASRLLRRLPAEVTTRASILGLHASVAAFREGRDWIDRAIAQTEANLRLFVALAAERLPGVRIAEPAAGYLAWVDLRDTGLGDDPARRILREGRVAFNNGRAFGLGGEGHARVNLACAPDTIVDAMDRIAAILSGVRA